jgi:hypothetical protein
LALDLGVFVAVSGSLSPDSSSSSSSETCVLVRDDRAERTERGRDLWVATDGLRLANLPAGDVGMAPFTE